MRYVPGSAAQQWHTMSLSRSLNRSAPAKGGDPIVIGLFVVPELGFHSLD